MFQAQNRETINSNLKSCVLQDYYDDERNKTMFRNTTPWPARPRPRQDHTVQGQDQNQDRFLKPVLS